MKLLFILYCLCIVSVIDAQSYIPLVTENARWDESFRNYNTTTFLDAVDGYSFFLKEDTTINNIVYSNVYHQHMWKQVRMSGGIIESTNLNKPALLIGGIREDTAARKVYYLDYLTPGWSAQVSPFPNYEVLLYDFSLDVGDNVSFGFYPNFQTVSDIYIRVFDDGVVRKKWELSYQNWFEGIGSDMGLFGPYRSDFSYASYDLNCFSTNGQYVFSGSYCDSVPETSTVSTADIPSLKYKIQLFPNPASSKIQLEILDISLLIHQINLIPATGKQYPVHFIETGRTLNIDVSSFPSGIYVLHVLLQDDQSLFEKVIIAQ